MRRKALPIGVERSMLSATLTSTAPRRSNSSSVLSAPTSVRAKPIELGDDHAVALTAADALHDPVEHGALHRAAAHVQLGLVPDQRVAVGLRPRFDALALDRRRDEALARPPADLRDTDVGIELQAA